MQKIISLLAAMLVYLAAVQANDDLWVDVNFTRDSTMWKEAFPALAPNGLNLQTTPFGEYLGFGIAGAFGKFAVTGYDYTPLNADNLNEQFIYAFRLSTGASSQWTFPVVPNAGTIRMHVLCGNASATGEFTLQKNTSGIEDQWEDFNPVIQFKAPAHNFSTKSFVVEEALNLENATMLRLKWPATRNVHLYAMTISKKTQPTSLQMKLKKYN